MERHERGWMTGASFDLVARFLMAGVATLVSAAATVGAMTGGVAFLLRNKGSSIGVALMLAAIAAAIAAAVVLWPRQIDRSWAVRAGAVLFSGVLLMMALFLVVRTQAQLASSGSRPVIEAEWGSAAGAPSLTITAKADGLAINDRLFANVLAYPRNQRAFLTYYSGFTGPDVNGHAEQKVAVPVPLTETEVVDGTTTTVPIGSVMVAAIVDKQQHTPLIEPGHATGVTCEGEVYATDSGRKVDESAKPLRTTTKPACIYLQSTAPSGSPAITSSASGRFSLDVPGNVAWTDSRIYVRQGQQLVIHARGQVTFVPGGSPVGPTGATDLHPGAGVLAGGEHHAALIGRIAGASSGPPFVVGDNYSGKADQSGLLVLGINDLGVDNNSGHFSVDVELGA